MDDFEYMEGLIPLVILAPIVWVVSKLINKLNRSMKRLNNGN